MADVFFSYSRKDKEFVRKLHGALAEAGRDSWVDWEDIPPTVEWLREIYGAIEGVDAVLFVVSPASITSPMCLKEIDHAVENHKRLIPVVIGDVDQREVPDPVAKLQWLFFRPGDDFQAAVQSLLGAIDTDIDWVRTHTRLLTRGLEWQAKQRDASLLLRGGDLKAAEGWLMHGPAKEPRPTPIHSEFIAASRRAANRRQRTLVGALVVGLVVTALLGAAAWVQRQEAVAQRDEAVRQRKVVLGKQLAAQSELLNSQKASLLDRSALLAIEAARRAPGPESDRALRKTLTILPVMLFERTQGKPIQAVALSPNGEQAAAGGDDGLVGVWRVTTGESVAEIDHGAGVNALAYSPDGVRLASASDKGVILQAVGQDRHLALPAPGARALAFSGDGRLLITGSAAGVVGIWNTATGENLRNFPTQGEIASVAFSPDSRLAAAGGSDNAARVWDIATGREIMRAQHHPASASMPLRLGSRDGGVFTLAFHQNGQYLATGAQDRTVSIWQIATGREVFRGYHSDSVYDVAFSPNGRWLASGGMDETARVWDLSNGSERYRLQHEYVVQRVLWDAEGNLLTASGDGTARVWDMVTGRESARMFHSGYVHGAAVSRDGRRVATGAWDGSVRVWDVAAAGEGARLPHQGNRDALFSPNGQLVVTIGETKFAQLWELPEGRLKHRFDHDDFLSSAAFSPDGSKLVTTGWDGTARVWDVESGKALAVLRHEGRVQDAQFNRKGTLVVTGGFVDGTARVWDPETGREVRRLQHPGAVEGPIRRMAPRGGVRSLVFDPSDSVLATAGQDGTVRLWNIDDGRELLRLADRGYADGMRFSPDGRYLVTDSEKDLCVWSLPGGERVAVLEKDKEKDEFMSLLGISPDGRLVLVGSPEGKSLQVRSMPGLTLVVALLHEDDVFSGQFNRDGTRLLTGSRDRTARVWDTATWQELTRVTAHDFVYHARYSPDERFFVTASGDGLARVWIAGTTTMIEAACRRLSRSLSKEEWRQYLGTEPWAPTCELPKKPLSP